jgi:hypothetical protein
LYPDGHHARRHARRENGTSTIAHFHHILFTGKKPCQMTMPRQPVEVDAENAVKEPRGQERIYRKQPDIV